MSDQADNFPTCPPGGAAGDKTEAGQTAGGFGSAPGSQPLPVVAQELAELFRGLTQVFHGKLDMIPGDEVLKRGTFSMQNAIKCTISRVPVAEGLGEMCNAIAGTDGLRRQAKIDRSSWRREPDGPSDHEPIDRKQTRHHVYL